jgi:hypothetical protein
MAINKILWIRDSNGSAIELEDVWVRSEGQLEPVSHIWVRDSNGDAILVYPESDTGGFGNNFTDWEG